MYNALLIIRVEDDLKDESCDYGFAYISKYSDKVEEK